MIATRLSSQGGWRSRWTFVAAATAATVGLGNLWKFAYLAGANGGAAFVLVYLLAVIVLAIPLLVAEVLLGSRGRANPVDSVRRLSIEASGHGRWQVIGWLGLLTGLLIFSYYSVIAGWVLVYVDSVLSGQFTATTAPLAAAVFNQLLAEPGRMMTAQAIFLVVVAVLAGFGVQRGVALVMRLLLPLILLMLAGLLLYSFRVADGAAALAFLFKLPATLTPQAVMVAVGHAFFTLSIGVAVMVSYGAYLPDRRSITLVVSLVALFDTLIALLAGLVIFPLVFKLNIEPTMGPGLMFVALPYAFGNMAYGEYVGGLFFLVVTLTAIGSGVALLEPMTVWLVERFRWWRMPAALFAAGLVWLLGLLTVFSFNLWRQWPVFSLLEFVSSNILLPLGAMLIAFFVGWVMRREVLRDELFVEHPWLFRSWHALLRYLVIPAILLVFVVNLYQAVLDP